MKSQKNMRCTEVGKRGDLAYLINQMDRMSAQEIEKFGKRQCRE